MPQSPTSTCSALPLIGCLQWKLATLQINQHFKVIWVANSLRHPAQYATYHDTIIAHVMVDPTTVAAAVAKVAQSAGEVGFVFDHLDISWEPSIVNEAVKHLAQELKQLGDVCDVVDKHVRKLSGKSIDAEDEELFRCVQLQLSACDRSMGRLVEAVKEINPDLDIPIKSVVCIWASSLLMHS